MDFLRAHLKRIVFIVFIASLISAAITMILLFKSPKKDIVDIKTSSQLLEKARLHVSQEPDKAVFTVLLLGYGGAGHAGGGLADAQLLMHVDTENKKTTAIAIPRDTWVEIPVRSDLKQYHKLNAAFAIGNDDNGYPLKQPQYTGQHGGGALAKYAVETITGLDVDYYAAIDFKRFENAIDALGGVVVDVPVAFNDYFYPIEGKENDLCEFSPEKMEEIHSLYTGFELEKQFTCRYEHLYFPKGPVNMDGSQALKFIRSRHSTEHGGDFARGVRQQAVLTGIKNKLLSLNAINNIDNFYAEFSQMINTDIFEKDVIELLSHIGSPDGYTLHTLNIDSDNFLTNATSADGQYVLIPKAGIGNFSPLHNFIAESVK